eukprot:4696375-Prymnesium_polylepis.1
MAAAASGRLAATAARHGAAAAALHALLDAVPDGASRAAARLLLRGLAAALGVEPLRQAQPGGGRAGEDAPPPRAEACGARAPPLEQRGARRRRRRGLRLRQHDKDKKPAL